MAEILTPDLCIIGAGAGGLAAAAAARSYGASVVVIERGRPGGDSLNAGLAAKALVIAGQQASLRRSSTAFGLAGDQPKVNFRRLHDHVQQLLGDLAPDAAASHVEALGAEFIAAEAKFVDLRTVAAGEVLVRARRIVVATGARPVVPEIPGLQDVPFFTSETIFDNTRKLTHLVIIGGGTLALELAQAYTRLGTEVTVVEPGRPLPGSDPELAAIALRRLAEEGVVIAADTTVTAVQARSQGIGVVVRSGEVEHVLDASHILVASGQQPDLAALELDAARIRRSRLAPERLQLDAGLRTTNRRVYAIGAAAGSSGSHLAAYQAGLVVRSALFGWPLRQQPLLLPSVTYCDPEIAEIGLDEAAARRRFRNDFVVTRWSFAQNHRARMLEQSHGVAKLVTRKSGRIVGAGIVGPAAGELIALFAFAIANRLSARHLAAFVAPDPSLADIARQLGLEAERHAAPQPLHARLLALTRLLP